MQLGSPFFRSAYLNIYQLYYSKPNLRKVLERGSNHRFGEGNIIDANGLSEAAINLIYAIGDSRNTPKFSRE